jgi:hypothetical protein
MVSVAQFSPRHADTPRRSVAGFVNEFAMAP